MLKHQCALNTSALHLVKCVIDSIIHPLPLSSPSPSSVTVVAETKQSHVPSCSHASALVAVGFPSTSSCKFTVHIGHVDTSTSTGTVVAAPSSSSSSSSSAKSSVSSLLTAEVIERRCSELIHHNARLFADAIVTAPLITPFKLTASHVGTDDDEPSTGAAPSSTATTTTDDATSSSPQLSYMMHAGGLGGIFVCKMKHRVKHAAVELHISTGDAALLSLAKRDVQQKKDAVTTKYKRASAAAVSASSSSSSAASSRSKTIPMEVKRTAVSDTAFHVMKGAVVKVLSCAITSSVHWTTATDATLQVVYEAPLPPSMEQLDDITRLCNDIIATDAPTKLVKMDRTEAETYYRANPVNGTFIYDQFPVDARHTTLTIFEIPGWNVNCCMGPHLPTLGAIQRIYVYKARHLANKHRLELSFYIGQQAIDAIEATVLPMVELKRCLSNDATNNNNNDTTTSASATPSAATPQVNHPLKVAKHAKALARSRSIERTAPLPPPSSSSEHGEKRERKHHQRRPRAAAVPSLPSNSDDATATDAPPTTDKKQNNDRTRTRGGKTTIAKSVSATDYAPRRPRSRVPVDTLPTSTPESSTSAATVSAPAPANPI